MLEIFAYIDPGSGFVFVQNTSLILGIILGLFGSLLFCLRLFFKFFKKAFGILFILSAILIIGGLMRPKVIDKKVVILGIDGMDPNLTERFIQEGRLPNFSSLKAKGAYSRLATTVPAESVVAWTSFATGLNPEAHGIFDFIMRDPQNYMPYLGLNGVEERPCTGRRANSFWKVLTEHNIPSFIYFCPNTFPAERILGKMLSGMGTPDLYGVMGRFSFYTNRASSERDKESRGKIIHIEVKDKIIDTKIYGPKIGSQGKVLEATVHLSIILPMGKDEIRIKFQDSDFIIRKGEWSTWQEISFKLSPFKRAFGIAKFYLKSISPEFELYMSPINFDPRRPPFPISHPKGLSKRLAGKLGLYYTQGMPHDTWALTEDRLDERAFLEHVDSILKEKAEILFKELENFKGGVFFFYIETLDIVGHMFWRYLDARHPLYEENSTYRDTIFKYYEEIDRILGRVLERLDNGTSLIVFSDHGFGPFRKSVHLNRWLLENGFLALKEGKDEGREFFEDVDWHKTKAYALGFGCIYLNRLDRERYGIVTNSEVEGLKGSISDGLRGLRDPQTNEIVVKEVYSQGTQFAYDGPDLVVGFNTGYRASWQTALGGVPALLIEENRKKWSGDHLVDPSLVPGVLFFNKKIELRTPSIIDIAPTILEIFGISKSNMIDGKILFRHVVNVK